MVKRNTGDESQAGPLENPKPTDPMIGKVLGGRFRVLSVVARGGMGKVYRAEQSPLNRIVALKVLDPSTNQDDDLAVFRERFFLEASTCAKLNHPNTVRIFDYGSTWDDVFYIAMEYLEGRTLQQVIRSEQSVEPVRLIRVVKQICGSLFEAHERGVIHRDLKPSNIFLTRHGDDDEFVKVLDFGLVKRLQDDAEMTDAGRLLGSPMYMSPEQVQCEPLDVRTDIYSLGMLMYIALTGKRPFKKTNSVSVLLSQIKENPPSFDEQNPNHGVPESLEWVVMTCLAKDRTRRFANIRELVKALKACELEATRTLEAPLVLRLNNGCTIVPPGLLSSVSQDVTLEELGGIVTDDSQTFELDAAHTGDSRQSLVVWAGLSAAGMMVFGSVALVLLLIAALYGLSNWDGGVPVDGAAELKTQPASVPPPQPDEAESSPESPPPATEPPDVPEQVKDAPPKRVITKPARSRRGRKHGVGTNPVKKVSDSDGQQGGVDGSLSNESAQKDRTDAVDSKSDKEKEETWIEEDDIRDPWEEER